MSNREPDSIYRLRVYFKKWLQKEILKIYQMTREVKCPVSGVVSLKMLFYVFFSMPVDLSIYASSVSATCANGLEKGVLYSFLLSTLRYHPCVITFIFSSLCTGF